MFLYFGLTLLVNVYHITAVCSCLLLGQSRRLCLKLVPDVLLANVFVDIGRETFVFIVRLIEHFTLQRSACLCSSLCLCLRLN